MHKKNWLPAAMLATLCAAQAQAQGLQVAQAAGAPVLATDRIPERDTVLRVVERTALSEIASIRRREAQASSAVTAINSNWVSASLFIATARLASKVDLPEVEAFNRRAASRLHYSLQGDGAPVHLINADDQAIGDLYQWVYQRTGSPGILLPLKQRLDYTVPYLRMEPAPGKLVWWWCDALYMAPPVLTRMSAITGDRSYIDAMDVQFWRTHGRLYDAQNRLFARDARFIERRSANGKKIFWSRGQGWVMAGLARVLEHMPQDYPSRARYVALFQQMADRLVGLQHADGLWRASLLDPEAHPEPEASGTALFTFALAYGINHGLLDRATYLPHVLKAWSGLNRYVLPDGRLGQVQSPGDQPVPTRRETTAPYASGAFILAGLEVVDLSRPATQLPVVLPPPPKLQYHAANWTLPPLPADARADQVREHQRGEAEREAVRQQAFDPVVDDPGYRSPLLKARGEKAAP